MVLLAPVRFDISCGQYEIEPPASSAGPRRGLRPAPETAIDVDKRGHQSFPIPHVEQVAEGHAYLDGIARRLWLSSRRHKGSPKCGALAF